MRDFTLDTLPDTEEAIEDWINQDFKGDYRTAVEGIYRCRRKLGDSTLEAVIYTLECVGNIEHGKYRCLGKPL